VTDDEIEALRQMLSTGFYTWTPQEYQKFIKAIRKNDLKDIKAIAEIVETKTVEEVQEYMDVFMLRFKELKERDVVIQKI